MKFFKKIKKWLLIDVQEELNKAEARAEYWRKEFGKADKTIKDLQFKNKQQCALLQSQKQRISELEDEIDIQRLKADKYLSYYIKEKEKHALND